MRGNLPQAFVHAMVAQAAIELGRYQAAHLARHLPVRSNS